MGSACIQNGEPQEYEIISPRPGVPGQTQGKYDFKKVVRKYK